MAGTVGEPCVGGSVIPARGRIALFGCGFAASYKVARTRLDAAMFRFRLAAFRWPSDGRLFIVL